MNVGVSGLVLAQHLWRRGVTLQSVVPTNTVRALDLGPGRAEGLVAVRRVVASTPSPPPQRRVRRQASSGRDRRELSLLWRGVGRDRPEAACPPGSRAAGGFNAVQKLLTNRTSTMTARTTSGRCGRSRPRSLTLQRAEQRPRATLRR